MITQSLMKQMWPHASDALISGIVATAPVVLQKYGLAEPLVLAHFLAQVSEECGAGTELVENLNYTSAASIARTWPSRFTEASAWPYIRQPQKLADYVYNGRMGNAAGSDDGWNFRGRGATQTTGHEGYTALGQKLSLDLISNPDQVNDPNWFLECGAADFILCGCLPFAQRDDIRGVTQHLNGGQIGEAAREDWLRRWKAVLSVVAPAIDENAPLAYGAKGWKVTALQQRLVALGYQVGKTDGDFGASTRAAVLALQADRAIPTTGIVDAATEAALALEIPRPIAEERETATVDDLTGSKIVADASTVKTTGGATGAIAAVAGLEQTGILDAIKSGTDQVGTVRSTIDSLQDVIHWATSHWWIGAIVVGFLVYHYGGAVIARRLADHRNGASM